MATTDHPARELVQTVKAATHPTTVCDDARAAITFSQGTTPVGWHISGRGVYGFLVVRYEAGSMRKRFVGGGFHQAPSIPQWRVRAP
jgi:hypothetical protein